MNFVAILSKSPKMRRISLYSSCNIVAFSALSSVVSEAESELASVGHDHHLLPVAPISPLSVVSRPRSHSLFETDARDNALNGVVIHSAFVRCQSFSADRLDAVNEFLPVEQNISLRLRGRRRESFLKVITMLS